jgi:hypothetical protein
MTVTKFIIRFTVWAVFFFLVLEVARKSEHNATIVAGERHSQAFAQSIVHIEGWAKNQKAADPAAMRQLNYEMFIARLKVHAITAIILAGIITLFAANVERVARKACERDRTSRMPNTALEPTATAPSVFG